MEISAHYYGIYALGIACGIKQDIAQTIAHASQFVDDALINTITFDKNYKDKLFPLNNKKSKVSDIATCHSYFVVHTMNYQSMIMNTSAFHFFPGNEGDTFTRKMRCKENPVILQDLISETISEKKLIPEKLGMLLHIYADTFSHQGFSGLISKENDITGLESFSDEPVIMVIKIFFKRNIDRLLTLFDRYVPAYGHAQAYHYPDVPTADWLYYYDKSDDFSNDPEESRNNNIDRYTKAFKLISKYLEKIQDKDVYNPGSIKNRKQNIQSVLDLLIIPMKNEKKIKAWKRLIEDLLENKNIDIEYNKCIWLEQAFKNYKKDDCGQRTLSDIELNPDYKNTSWYAFVEALKWYKPEFIKRLGKAGLKIPQ